MGRFMKNANVAQKLYIHFDKKNALAYILGNILTSSSGYLGDKPHWPILNLAPRGKL
jgi:hypothetical protein